MNEIVKQIFQGIVDGQQDVVAAGVDAALTAGVPARTILDEGMLAAMAEVGRRANWRRFRMISAIRPV